MLCAVLCWGCSARGWALGLDMKIMNAHLLFPCDSLPPTNLDGFRLELLLCGCLLC